METEGHNEEDVKMSTCTRCGRSFRECWSAEACAANIRDNEASAKRRAASRAHYATMTKTQEERDALALVWAHDDVFGTEDDRR